MLNSKNFTRFSGFLLCLNLLACGPASEYVTVKIITPIGMGKKFRNISEDLMSFNMNPVSCSQSQLFVGTNDGVESERLYNKKVQLTSLTSGCTSGQANVIDCMQNYSSLAAPIEIQVLKGKLVDIGLIGAFYLPQDTTPADGICDVVDGSVSRENYSLVGHSIVNISEPQTVTLNTFVLKAYQSTVPSVYSCFGTKCANTDLLHIVTDDQDQTIVKQVDYFYDATNGQHVEHYLDVIDANAADFYIPHVLPVTITYKCVSDAFDSKVVVSSTSNTPQILASCSTFYLYANSL